MGPAEGIDQPAHLFNTSHCETRMNDVVLTPRSLVPIGVLVATLVLSIPTAWTFGIRWGEVTSGISQIRLELDQHKDNFKIVDTRLRRLENLMQTPGETNHVEPEPQRSVRPVSKRDHLFSQSASFDRYWSFVHDASSDDGREVDRME